MNGNLYVVSLPIGNIKDITYHAVEILKFVDYILCEDTREFAKIARAYDIKTKCISYHMYNENNLSNHIKNLQSNQNIALTCDRGTPVLHDPGFELLRSWGNLTNYQNIKIIPGASAVTSTATLNPFDFRYTFIGFVSNLSDLKKYKNLEFPCLFFESRHRILNFLKECLKIFGNRRVLLCRELTKEHQEILVFELNNVPIFEVLGEISLIIESAKGPEVSISLLISEIINEISISSRDLSIILSKIFKEKSKNKIYSEIILQNKS